MVTAATILAILGATPAAAQPASGDDVVEYVNLGDSFAAGSGIPPIAAGQDPRCLQSERNFARTVAEVDRYRLTDVSCGGAETSAFFEPQNSGTRPQLDALSADTDLVTLVIGGNDNSIYSGLTRGCIAAHVAQPGAPAPCTEQLAKNTAIEAILPNIVTALEQVHQRSPDADVYIVGYPWVVPASGGCPAAVPVAEGDVPFLRDVQRRLNDTIRAAAEQTGTTFVDMSVVSDGRDACAPPDERWVEPVIGVRDLSILHPNAAGQRGIAEQVLAAIGS